MQDTLFKNELRNIKKNETNSKAGYTVDLLNPDKPVVSNPNPRESGQHSYGLRKTEGLFGSTGRIGFEPVDQAHQKHTVGG